MLSVFPVLFDFACTCVQPQFFTQKSEPKRSMRFTTPSIASAGGSVFACEKYSFPQPDSPSLLLFRRPPPSLRSTFPSGCRGMGEGPRSSDSSSREGDANAHDPKQVPQMIARALELFSDSGLCRRDSKNRCLVTHRSFRRMLFRGAIGFATPS